MNKGMSFQTTSSLILELRFLGVSHRAQTTKVHDALVALPCRQYFRQDGSRETRSFSTFSTGVPAVILLKFLSEPLDKYIRECFVTELRRVDGVLPQSVVRSQPHELPFMLAWLCCGDRIDCRSFVEADHLEVGCSRVASWRLKSHASLIGVLGAVRSHLSELSYVHRVDLAQDVRACSADTSVVP
eukprot:CAMPEP_0195574508 /NCGR_PEP_ID=MMETSP0814-20130614/5996_1 /TAXON_ID=97485 /ORGANISM="Prymnesium parvum, Strain Texoma1" /LENGTH=185 /DNA_ID=CAMNT_0040710511 /DNA_START=250 /DNA_END=807 /DNA_ORIENTATION=-